MMTLVNVAFLMLSVVLVVFTLNVTHIVSDRTDLQHTADAASASAANAQARMMNSLTGANHVIGEMTGMVIVHHGIGGDLLDRGETPSTNELREANNRLESVYNFASSLNGVTDLTAYRTVRETGGKRQLTGEATLLDSKIELKKWLTFVYINKGAGRALQKYPPTKPAGVALETSMHPLELKIYQEMETLRVLEGLARGLLGTKRLVRGTAIPNAKDFTDRLVEMAPDLMQRAAEEVLAQMQPEDEKYAVELFTPDGVGLPVQIDPLATASSLPQLPATTPPPSPGCCSCGSERTAVTRDQIVKVTQLARAAFPWVTYHREPLLKSMRLLLPLAKSAEFYKDHTDGYSKQICRELQEDEGITLYVLKGYAAPDKGYAPWTEQREEADRFFSTTAVIWAPASPVIGAPAAFSIQQPNGRIAVAQSLLYNANPWEPSPRRIDLTCKRITPNLQPVFGQDTLNWDQPVPELIAKTDSGGAPSSAFPEIKLNWQTKIVPSSAFVFDEMRAAYEEFEDEDLEETLERLLEETPTALIAH